MNLSNSLLTEALIESQTEFGLHEVSFRCCLSAAWHSLLTLSMSFCSLNVFSSRSLSLSCCAFSCFSSCFFFDSAMVLSKISKQIAHFSPPLRQQQLTQTVTDTRVCFDILGGNGNRTKLLIWLPLRMLSYRKEHKEQGYRGCVPFA